ncbi:competence protein CoiA family protein [Nostoc sp. 'Peltigera malacea cyanobiont' DB3992]|uniref:competence protein CoiA family protein n=1 Tax=Nostoc sp. 'Peltigera malacea cyanobiont' DB3992 TaxID=1206980 RepID=UPI0015D4EB59|nr:hypothetical protein [Nostoc sp. 'Peltigera malacea cyanobiont' DB3992]
MEYAISIYKGSKRVYAKDCDFVSYSVEGLICPICKQEVYLRKGDIREPYFAHFHATSSRQVEECELRVSADGNSTETSSFIENRGQRLEIFQQHFLSLIYFENSKIIEDVKFNNWINSRKDESNQIINDIIRKCIDYFLENRQLMEAKYIVHTTKNKNKQILLQQKISLEVMSYLCDNAKFNYNLRYLLFYSMYQIYQYEKHKLIRQNIKTQDIEKICQYTVRIIMRNSWILAFKNTKINGVNNKTQQNIIKINKNRISSTSSPLQSVSSTIMGGKKQSTPIIYTMTVAKGIVTILYHYSEKIKNTLTEQTETIYKERIIATMTAAPGTLKISFEQITLDKLAFADYSFHHELLEQYTIPFWIMNAENYVLSNKLPPVWLVTSKLIQLTCMDENTGTLDLNSLQNTLPFTEIQWYQTLIGCHNQCPSVPQFTNAVNNIPDKFKYLVNPVDIKLNRYDINVRPKPTTTNRINTGLLGNWSQPFFLQLEPGQYLSDKLGTNPVQCQVAMENQLLVLYTLDKSFTRSDAVSASHSKKSFSANLTQHRTKLLTIGTIELSEIPITKWSATQPQYETLAKLLNKSTNLPDDVKKQYKELLLTNETLSIGNRVLCKKNVIGNKVLVKSYLNSKYCESHNQPKPECIWLDQLRNDITKKMLQANYKEVKRKVENYVINNSDTAIHKAERDVNKCTQSARSVIRLYQPSCSDSDIGRLALLITEYILTKLNLNKSQAVDLLKSLKTDVNQYIKIRDLVITPQLDHLKENDS